MLDQFCCTVVKRGNLLLQMRRGCVRCSVVWSGWCVGWDWLMRCQLMFSGKRWVLLWRYDNSKSYAVVWSCHPSRHHVPNTWDYRAWNYWKKEQGSNKKIVGRISKEEPERYGLRREDAYDQEKWRELKKQKIANPKQLG